MKKGVVIGISSGFFGFGMGIITACLGLRNSCKKSKVQFISDMIVELKKEYETKEEKSVDDILKEVDEELKACHKNVDDMIEAFEKRFDN